MKVIKDQIKGPLDVRENTTLFGQLVGSATVHRGCRLIVHGQVIGSVTVTDTGVLELRGQIIGDVINAGQVENHGEIFGNLREQ